MSINEPTITSNGIVRPTHVEVNLTRLTENYRAIERAVSPAAIMPILKANAYGHGLIEVARHFSFLDAPYLGVAYLEEGILLREHGITTPILVLGGILGNQVPLFLEYDLTLTASSLEKLEQTNKAARSMGKQAKVHLKIDTGMERLGVHYYSAGDLLEASLACNACQIEGIFSHFANSDSADLASARIQLDRFNEVLDFYDRRGIKPPLRHFANSGAILQLPDSHFDMVRPGIMLFGVYPSDQVPHSIPVRPALSWKSQVVYFKVVKPDHPVSYGSTWQSDHMVRVVTIPTGYGDGYFRSLSNNSYVIIRGKKYPVIGRVCMDQMMVNIEWETAYNGDEVILIGESPDGGQTITCSDLAQWAGTIPYEVLTNINTRVSRIYTTKDD
ncbi:MAG TPA: alanine racemase [candidate division Zixibacteria bacterium]|nr:alanine racemase [candidate division Zixibacteria bacterium]